MMQDNETLSMGFHDDTEQYLPSSSLRPSSLFNDQFDNPWDTELNSDSVTNLASDPMQRGALLEDTLLLTITPASVLVGVDVPEVYDTAYCRAGPTGDRVSVESLEKVMALSGVLASTLEEASHIVSIVVPTGSLYVTRDEFNTALALVACAQKHMDLPELILPNVETLSTQSNPRLKTHQDRWGGSPAPKPDPLEPTAQKHSPPPKSSAPNIPEIQYRGWFESVDRIRVILLAEKEGFLFKHVNYRVESEQCATGVTRRYSDFYWLHQMLLRRYPCRLLPSLPPKHMRAKRCLEDSVFLERRRKGLERFLSCLVRHPVIAKDDLVAVFLKEASSLRIWVKKHAPVIQEATVDISFEEMKRGVPVHLKEGLETVRARVDPLIHLYTAFCEEMHHIIRLARAHSEELVRYSSTLNEMRVLEQACYTPDCLSCGYVVHGYGAISKHMQRAGEMQEDHATTSLQTTLETLTRHKALLVSLKELLERTDSQLSRLSNTRTKQGTASGEVHETQRHVLIQYCLAFELSYLHKHQAFASMLYQTYVSEQIKYQRQLSDHWKALQVLAYEMPSDPNDFF
ncbi:hypothetical protein BDF14DRAFT_1878834 [Spinellus fusiger]|nr:hypothetical protein BDF14DRAFT_1878834 [Spinellus fusiger]